MTFQIHLRRLSFVCYCYLITNHVDELKKASGDFLSKIATDLLINPESWVLLGGLALIDVSPVLVVSPVLFTVALIGIASAFAVQKHLVTKVPSKPFNLSGNFNSTLLLQENINLDKKSRVAHIVFATMFGSSSSMFNLPSTNVVNNNRLFGWDKKTELVKCWKSLGAQFAKHIQNSEFLRTFAHLKEILHYRYKGSSGIMVFF